MRQRDAWESLNGEWEFAHDGTRLGLTNRWFENKTFEKTIFVPFAHQTPMSGIGDLSVLEVVWYARTFHVPAEWIGLDRDLLLHFGAVDYQCTVWINGIEVGHNEGGHVPFAFDIGPFVHAGDNRVFLRVEDSLDPYQPRGKQSITGVSHTVSYHNTTGIWQSVWLEPVSSLRIEDLVLRPYVTSSPESPDHLDVDILVHGPGNGLSAELEMSLEGQSVGRKRVEIEHGKATCRIEVPTARRWSPEQPNLYDIKVSLFDGDQLLDTVRSYTGFRKIVLKQGQVWLNEEPILLKMVLDQGYWPDSGMTAPNDQALRADVEWCKQMGFNGVRKHQKVEDPRWLHWCDRLGLLVWSEMANAVAWSPKSEERLTAEWERAVRRDINHPCIMAWVPLNESWGVPGLSEGHPGQYAFVERLVALTRRLDGTRPIIDNDGWEHTDVTDIFAIHDYSFNGHLLKERYASVVAGGPMQTQSWGKRPMSYLAKGARYRGQPVVLSEIGGFLTLPESEDGVKLDPLYASYAHTGGGDELLAQYRDLMESISSLTFVAGFCYTQLTDVEQERNGLLTFDRRPKVDPAELKKIHESMDKDRLLLHENVNPKI